MLKVFIKFIAILCTISFVSNGTSSYGATKTWSSALDGYWDDPAKWNDGTVPVAVDEVEVSVDGIYTITVDNGSAVRSLTLGGAGSKFNLSLPSGQTFTVNPATPGTIVKKIPYPSGVPWIGDMVYDVSDKTVWLLAGSQTVLDKFMQIDETGAVLKTVPNSTFWINHGSELAFDGANLWATSYGWSNGVPQSYIYKIDPLTGSVATSFPCPASSTGGFCEGITWDGSQLWSATSDNRNLVSYTTNGTLQSLFLNEFSTIGTNTHLSYHSSLRCIIAFHDGVNLIDPATGATMASNISIYPYSSGWDSHNNWRANNSTQEIEVVYLGF